MAVRGYRICEGVEIFDGGAAMLTDEGTLVVADLHLGCEAALEYDGLSIPRVQTKKIGLYLQGLLDSLGPARLVVAGDMKHNFSRNLVQEWQDVRRFVDMLCGRVKLEVVRGNHDNYLGSILKECDVPFVKETTLSGVRIIHGHQGSLGDGRTVMGHIHPSIRLKDRTGASIKSPCFLFDPGRKVLVLPALSLVSPGTDVVSQEWADRISPPLSESGLSPFEPVAFSGSKPLRFPAVGELRKLRTEA